MLNPFIELLSSILNLFSFMMLVWVVMSMLYQFNVLSHSNQVVNKIFHALSQLVDPVLNPIRTQLFRLFPRLTMLDLSPVVALLLINFINSALFQWFYSAPASVIVR